METEEIGGLMDGEVKKTGGKMSRRGERLTPLLKTARDQMKL